MINNEILTALQNALERGETLEHAVHILINSGYPSNEVRENSHYLGSGTLPHESEELVYPEKKGFFSKITSKISGIFKRNKKDKIKKQDDFNDNFEDMKNTISNEIKKDNKISKQNSNKPIKNINHLNNPIKNISHLNKENKNYQDFYELKKDVKKTKKRPYLKEIILLLILLVLVGVLIITILYRDKIINFLP